jgi:hypothetical protein
MPETTVTAPPSSPIEARVEELRALAEGDPTAAREAAWEWFRELRRDVRRDRPGASAKLNELFRLGTPPAGIDGRTEGIFVTPLIASPVDAVFRAVTSAWMPWLGKRFDAAEARGDNVLRSNARLPSKLLWPRYTMGDADGDSAAFEFETGVEPGRVDPDRDVLKIDYAAVERNPRLFIKPIRDELVQIVPGANLGKILWRGRSGYRLIGYFALKS